MKQEKISHGFHLEISYNLSPLKHVRVATDTVGKQFHRRRPVGGSRDKLLVS